VPISETLREEHSWEPIVFSIKGISRDCRDMVLWGGCEHHGAECKKRRLCPTRWSAPHGRTVLLWDRNLPMALMKN